MVFSDWEWTESKSKFFCFYFAVRKFLYEKKKHILHFSLSIFINVLNLYFIFSFLLFYCILLMRNYIQNSIITALNVTWAQVKNLFDLTLSNLHHILIFIFFFICVYLSINSSIAFFNFTFLIIQSRQLQVRNFNRNSYVFFVFSILFCLPLHIFSYYGIKQFLTIFLLLLSPSDVNKNESE